MSPLRAKRLPARPEIEGFDTREHAILAHAAARHTAAQADAEDAPAQLRLAVVAVMQAKVGDDGSNPVTVERVRRNDC